MLCACFSRRFDTSLLGSWMFMAKFILILAPGPFWFSQRALSSHHPLLHDMDISFETLLAKSENHPGILVVLLVLTFNQTC